MSDSESDIGDEDMHAASLRKLKTKDPDFFEFLKENDKSLLDFANSDGDEDEKGSLMISENDEEEDEDGEMSTGNVIKNYKNLRLEDLKNEIQNSPSVHVCKKLISLFNSVVQVVSSDKSAKNIDCVIFDDVIKLCLVELAPALIKVFKVHVNDDKMFDPAKSKMWKKMTNSIKCYLKDLIKVLQLMSEPSSLVAIVKHILQLIPFYLKFIKFARELLKKMISVWCTNDESVRVLSVLVIVRVTRELSEEYQNQILKNVYFAYVKNTKFTSASSWPLINFMKHSLTSVYAINSELAYQHAFVYIRQLSIHLRNAITMKKKEAYQTVYNWQYIHCLLFWGNLLSAFKKNDAVRTLIYPLVQIIIGTINLIPTVKYAPLRFHLVDALLKLIKETGLFIPVAPLLLEVLAMTDFNKKSVFSKKPINFACALKASKAQLQESGFKDSVVNNVCTLLQEYFSCYSHTIAFPELIFPATVQIKNFTKKCKVAKYNQQLKSLVEKLTENSKFIEGKRKHFSGKLNNETDVKRWEDETLRQGVPLNKSCKRNIESDSEHKAKKLKK